MSKRTVLVLLLALVLSTLSASVVYANVVNPTDGTKNSDFEYSDIEKDTPSYADTLNGQSAHDDDVFYVPGATPGSQRIHANYSANTDACAACHFTHSAPGTRLLQWGSIYEACAACHDGSLGNWTYDVFAGKIGVDADAPRTLGGLFGSTVDEVYDSNNYLEPNPSPANPTSISNHMSNGFMALSAAPGAKDNSTESDIQFDCASCHTPHGQGGNARILNPDPGKLKIDDFFPANGAAYPINISAKPNKAEFIEQLTVAAPGIKAFQSNSPSWIQGYPYNRMTGIFVTNGVEPVIQFNPQDTTHKGIYSDTANVTQLTYGTDYTIDWRKGIVDIADGYNLAGKAVYAVRVPGIFVAMKISNYLSYVEPIELVEHVEMAVDQGGHDGASDPNSGLNAFCGACHGKYNTQGNEADVSYDFIDKSFLNHGSGHFDDVEGMYRHQVGFKWLNQWPGEAKFVKFAFPIDRSDGSINTSIKIVTCLSCHFAHGVNNQYWYDYVERVMVGNISEAPEGLRLLSDMQEIYGSSALKRLPNMGTCEDCHDKSEGNSKDTTDEGDTYY